MFWVNYITSENDNRSDVNVCLGYEGKHNLNEA